MKWLLDTNACIHIRNGTSAPVIARFRACSPRQLTLCAVVKAELLYGARKSRRVTEKIAHLDRFFAPLSSLPFDDACAAEYGLLRADLASRGTPIGSKDLMIAAIARAHDLIVVTNNIDAFTRVVGLRWRIGRGRDIGRWCSLHRSRGVRSIRRRALPKC